VRVTLLISSAVLGVAPAALYVALRHVRDIEDVPQN
jgi:hypothetical protein